MSWLNFFKDKCKLCKECYLRLDYKGYEDSIFMFEKDLKDLKINVEKTKESLVDFDKNLINCIKSCKSCKKDFSEDHVVMLETYLKKNERNLNELKEIHLKKDKKLKEAHDLILRARHSPEMFHSDVNSHVNSIN